MNLEEALQYLHDRHPDVVDPPGESVDRATLNLDAFWFQAHLCERIDAHADADVRRGFESVQHLLLRGDRTVREAVCDHMVQPDLCFHEELDWAIARMPPLVAGLCRKIREVA